MSEEKVIEIYIDGCSLGNPGPSGWACIIKNEKESLGGFELVGTFGRVDSLSKGTTCTAYAKCENSTLGADALGELGKPAEIVGKEAAESLVASLKEAVTFDKFMSDQILLFAALADGTSHFTIERLTNHAETNMYIIETILGEQIFKVDGKNVKVKGIGLSP